MTLRACLFASLVACFSCAEGGSMAIDAGDTGVDSPDCSPSCLADEICVAGECVLREADQDNDGIVASQDCNDGNPAIGRQSSEACTTDCGTGMRSCTDGVWTGCDAPADCSCSPGSAPRNIDCGQCGTQTQTCENGNWRNTGACEGQGACAAGTTQAGMCPNGSEGDRTCQSDCTWGAWNCAATDCSAGDIDRQMESCGSCGGMRERSRTCVGGAWGTWGSWSACMGDGGACAPGDVDVDNGSCGNCGSGTRARQRTCQNNCTWGAWGSWGSCSGATGCAPTTTRPCPNGEPCGHQVCSNTCSWGACEPVTPGGCLRIRPGQSTPGTNYRCCTLTPSDQGWQYCLPGCQWSATCEATNAC